MATQGLLSIVKNNQVHIKVICGWNGDCIPELKEKISSLTPEQMTPEIVHQHALDIVGGSDRLVTQYATDKCIFEDKEFEPKQGDNYFKHFNDPTFNPRWDHGTSDYTEVIVL
jgi:hypothetical protein